MNELSILNTIKNITGDKYIGDDCAYLKDLGIVVTQDSLVEDIHFKRNWLTPFQLGYKSAVVNISDILAAGAKMEYLSVAISLPNNLPDSFVNDFYLGINKALNGAKVIGGDITGSSDKIFISITAIGITACRNISSRKNAKPGYVIITKGQYGSSAAGLDLLLNNKTGNNELIKAHLEPELDYDFSAKIAETVKEPYAMMDTSDGLADALFRIADASGVMAVVDYNSIPHLPDINSDFVLFGGEDYNPVAVVPEKYLQDFPDAIQIGKIDKYDGIKLDISGKKFAHYDELNVFNHFGENNG